MLGKACVKKTVCPPGFEAIAYLCFDVDECATQKHNCSDTEFCINKEGEVVVVVLGRPHSNVEMPQTGT